MGTFKILGLRVERGLLQKCDGVGDHDFKHYEEMGDIYIILLEKNDIRYELKLWVSEDECGSGWTTASWGHSSLKTVDHFSGKTHLPTTQNDVIELKMSSYSFGKNDIEDTQNKYFHVSYDGGDNYYPAGDVSVNMDNFKVINEHRILDRRPIWFFIGESSDLANQFNDLEVYETDSKKDLPNEIRKSVIVFGGKYRHTIDKVKEKIVCADECEIVFVHFSRKCEIKELELEIEHLKYKPPGDEDFSDLGKEEDVIKDSIYEPTYVLHGDSCAGKSYLASKLDDFEVYETDSNKDLPDEITAQIIVVGNKYGHTPDEVKGKIDCSDDCGVIFVHFSREEDVIGEMKLEIEQLKSKPTASGYESAKADFNDLVKKS